MPGRRTTRRHRTRILIILGIWLTLIVIGITERALGAAGWVVLTVLIALIAYLGGRRHGPLPSLRISRNASYGQAQGRTSTDKLRASSRYGLPDGAYLGGAFPGPVADTDAVSAYPADLNAAYPASARIMLTHHVTEALRGMGWPKSGIDPDQISRAIATVTSAGHEPTVSSVLPVILRETGETKSRRVEP